MSPTDPTLAAILAEMDRSATKGPWRRTAPNQWGVTGHVIDNRMMLGIVGHDAEVCAALRNALPALARYTEAAELARGALDYLEFALARVVSGKPCASVDEAMVAYKTASAGFDAAEKSLRAALAGTPKEEGNG